MDAKLFLLMGFIILVLLAINCFLLWHFNKNRRKLNQLLENGKIKNFKEILLAQKNKNEELAKRIDGALMRIKGLEETSESVFQKIGVIRFNPFNDVGGNQSFVIALLDNKNNGFLISSLFIKEGSRVYAKTVKQGKSEYTLSEEEKEALEMATSYKKEDGKK